MHAPGPGTRAFAPAMPAPAMPAPAMPAPVGGARERGAGRPARGAGARAREAGTRAPGAPLMLVAALPRDRRDGPAWSRLPPETKLAALVATAAAVVALPAAAIAGFVTVALVLAALAAWARVPLRWLAGRLWLELPFAIYAALLPFVAAAPDARVFGMPWSSAGAIAAAALLAKATLSLLAASIVAATTPTADLLRGAERLGLPALLVAVAGFMLRYVDLVADDLRRARVAMVARGFRGRGAGAARVLGSALGHLFVRAFERGERVHHAMLARGYAGRLPPSGGRRAGPAAWAAAALVPLIAWSCVALARLAG